MVNLNKISSLYGLVGLRQPTNPAYALLDADNQVSRSGRFITDNAFCKIEYIYDNLNYKDSTPEQFNAFLKNKQETAIKKVVDSIFDRADFIDRQILYQNANNKTEVESLPDGFVGFEVEIVRDKNWAFEITRAILEFSGTGDVEIVFWNSNKKEPLFSKVVTITEETQEETLNWRLDNTDATYKGKYYLGYLTQGLTVAPFKRAYENADVKSVITGMAFNSIEVGGHSDASTLFDLTLVDGSSINTGINIDVTVFKDATNLVLQNQFMFAKAVELQFTIDLLSEIVASNRFNINERLAQDMVIELEGLDVPEGITKTGLRKHLMGELNHLKKEIRRIQDGYFYRGFTLNTLT